MPSVRGLLGFLCFLGEGKTASCLARVERFGRLKQRATGLEASFVIFFSIKIVKL